MLMVIIRSGLSLCRTALEEVFHQVKELIVLVSLMMFVIFVTKRSLEKRLLCLRASSRHGGAQVKPNTLAAPVSGVVIVDQQSKDVPTSIQLNPDLRSYLPHGTYS